MADDLRPRRFPARREATSDKPERERTATASGPPKNHRASYGTHAWRAAA
jgi:hypothetical protein